MEEPRARHGHKIHEGLASREGCERLVTEVLSVKRGKTKICSYTSGWHAYIKKDSASFLFSVANQRILCERTDTVRRFITLLSFTTR